MILEPLQFIIYIDVTLNLDINLSIIYYADYTAVLVQGKTIELFFLKPENIVEASLNYLIDPLHESTKVEIVSVIGN